MSQARYLIVTGPPGSKKTEIIAALKAMDTNFRIIRTHTTRPPETAGEPVSEAHYFSSEDDFRDLLNTRPAFFVEWTRVANSHYGTSKMALQNVIDSDQIGLLSATPDGASRIEQYVSAFSAAVVVFIDTDRETLETVVQKTPGLDSETSQKMLQDIQYAFDVSGEFQTHVQLTEVQETAHEIFEIFRRVRCDI